MTLRPTGARPNRGAKRKRALKARVGKNGAALAPHRAIA